MKYQRASVGENRCSVGRTNLRPSATFWVARNANVIVAYGVERALCLPSLFVHESSGETRMESLHLNLSQKKVYLPNAKFYGDRARTQCHVHVRGREQVALPKGTGLFASAHGVRPLFKTVRRVLLGLFSRMSSTDGVVGPVLSSVPTACRNVAGSAFL